MKTLALAVIGTLLCTTALAASKDFTETEETSAAANTVTRRFPNDPAAGCGQHPDSPACTFSTHVQILPARRLNFHRDVPAATSN